MAQIASIPATQAVMKDKHGSHASKQDVLTSSLPSSNFALQLDETSNDVSVFKSEEKQWQKENQNKQYAQENAKRDLLSKQMQSDMAASQLFQNTQMIKQSIETQQSQAVSTQILQAKQRAFETAVHKQVEADTAHIHAAAVPQGDPLVTTQADSGFSKQLDHSQKAELTSFTTLGKEDSLSTKATYNVNRTQADASQTDTVRQPMLNPQMAAKSVNTARVAMNSIKAQPTAQSVHTTNSQSQDNEIENLTLIATEPTKKGTKAEQAQAKLESAQGMNRWEELADKMKVLESNGKDKLTIQLRPENLGRLDVSLLKEKDGLVAQLKASNAEAKNLLDTNKKAIQTSLENKGIQVKSVQVLLLPHAIMFHGESQAMAREDENLYRAKRSAKSIGEIYTAEQRMKTSEKHLM